MAKRLATLFAMLGVAAGIAAPFRVERVFVANTGHGITVTLAPAVVDGSWLCAAAIVVLSAVALTSKAMRHTAQGGDPA